MGWQRLVKNNAWLMGLLEKEMATHSSTLAWRLPWMEEPGGLWFMGSQRVGYDWATSLSLSCIGEGNGNPLQCSYLENPRDRGAWWAVIYGVLQSRTWLKRLSSSSMRLQWVTNEMMLWSTGSMMDNVGCYGISHGLSAPSSEDHDPF